MPQSVLPYKVQQEVSSSGMTALGGLPAYLDLARVLNLTRSVGDHVKAGSNRQGGADSEVVLSLMLLQLSGGEWVDDLRILQDDAGFCRVLHAVQAEFLDASSTERRKAQRRWREEMRRAVPSPSFVFRFLDAFGMDESTREERKAWIPQAPRALLGLRQVNRDLIAGINRPEPRSSATLDVDATLKTVYKDRALHCYKGARRTSPSTSTGVSSGSCSIRNCVTGTSLQAIRSIGP